MSKEHYSTTKNIKFKFFSDYVGWGFFSLLNIHLYWLDTEANDCQFRITGLKFINCSTAWSSGRHTSIHTFSLNRFPKCLVTSFSFFSLPEETDLLLSSIALPFKQFSTDNAYRSVLNNCFAYRKESTVKQFVIVTCNMYSVIKSPS